MSELLKCDGCGATCHPDWARHMSDQPWFEVADPGGGSFDTRHACSPSCLVRIGQEMTLATATRPAATQDAE